MSTHEPDNHESADLPVDDATATPEPVEGVVEEAPADAGASELDAVTAQRDEYLDALQRMKAEFDNYRRRAERDRQSLATGGARELVRGLLPVVDNLERAVEALGDQGEAIVAGVEMVRAQLASVLAGQGVEEIPADAEFDPTIHEAIAQVPVPGQPAGRIVEVVEKGYRHAEVVLRPTKVVVASEPPQ